MHELGFKTVTMALTDKSIASDDPDLNKEPHLAIVMGTEGDGLPQEAIDACDYTVRIDMAYGVDSLNVNAAAAVAFWQLRINDLRLTYGRRLLHTYRPSPPPSPSENGRFGVYHIG